MLQMDYGDIVKLSDYRDTGTYFIGKNGKLLEILIIIQDIYQLYKITQYLDDALYKYEFAYGITHIVKYDDKFIKKILILKIVKY